MIVALRRVRVPSERMTDFGAWISANQAVRRAHGIVAELVLARSPRQNPAKAPGPADDGALAPDELIVLTVWPDHETFDAWIATPERDAITASPIHQAVEFRPLTRYDVVAGYVGDDPVATDPRGEMP